MPDRLPGWLLAERLPADSAAGTGGPAVGWPPASLMTETGLPAGSWKARQLMLQAVLLRNTAGRLAGPRAAVWERAAALVVMPVAAFRQQVAGCLGAARCRSLCSTIVSGSQDLLLGHLLLRAGCSPADHSPEMAHALALPTPLPHVLLL